MGQRLRCEVVLRVSVARGRDFAVGFVSPAEQFRTSTFETLYLSLPPRDPDSGQPSPDAAAVKKLFKEVQTLKKVNLRVPSDVPDAVHMLLEVKDGTVARAQVTIKLLSVDGSQESILSMLDLDDVIVDGFSPKEKGTYIARLRTNKTPVKYDY